MNANRLGRWLWAVLIALAMLLPASSAAALNPVSTVTITARITPDGAVQMTERRVLTDPRPVEFVELLIPSDVEVDQIGVADPAGAYKEIQGTESLTDRSFRIERAGGVLYIEWQASSGASDVTVSYRMKNALVIHKDALEWYWPALAGGARPIAKVDAAIEMPSAAGAVLYAYGGEKGGVRIDKTPFRVSAVNIKERHSFEWRLLVPLASMKGAAGRPGTSDMATLQAGEELRIERELGRARKLWIAHWFLALAPLVLGGLWWLTVRRHSPDPAPSTLLDRDLMNVPPATVGWVYDSAWLDFGVAQLMYLERQGAVRWRWRMDRTLEISRVPGVAVSEADQRLLEFFRVDEAGVTPAEIEQAWIRGGARPKNSPLLREWLKAVEATVPPEWISRPSSLFAWVAAGLYVLGGVVSGAWAEWLALWVVAAVLVVMAYKRRWLSALGESYIARWVTAYYAAVPRHYEDRSLLVPEVPPEYMLAVEVGDAPLEKLMGSERYAVVKELYEYLDD